MLFAMSFECVLNFKQYQIIIVLKAHFITIQFFMLTNVNKIIRRVCELS